MAKLKGMGIGERPKVIDVTPRYYRARLRNPREFTKLRIKDIGRSGHTKLIVGRPKGMTATRTQSVLIPRGDVRLR